MGNVNENTNKTLRILYIEDNPGDVVLIREMLSESKDISFQLESADNLSTAIKLLTSEGVDIILSDLNLPDSEGIETFEKLIKSFPNIPIIVMSGVQDEELAVKAVGNGAQDYLVKGHVDSRLLIRAVRYAIERKRSEEALRLSEIKYKQLADSLPQIVFETDEKGMLTFVNQHSFEIMGYEKKDLMNGLHALQMLIPADRERAQKNIVKVMKGGKTGGTEYTALRKDGTTYPIVVHSNVIIHENKPVGIRGIIIDLTERKKVEKAQRESEERYRTLFERVPDGIYLSTAEGKFVDVNPALVEIYGYDNKEDLMNIDIKNKLYVNSQDRDKATEKEQKTGTAVVRQRRKDGSIIWVEDRGDFIKDENGNIVYHEGILRDVTDRILAEERIKTSLKEKELLLKEIHHRVKNNLQVVSSLLNLQSNDIKDEKALSAFKDSINRVSSMALVHEKLYESENFAKIDFKGYLESILNEVYHFSQLNGRIKFNIDIEDISLGLDDAIPCGLLINELVSNSLKYAFPNGNKGRIDISFKKIKNETFQLIVHDTGVGMPEQFDFENNTSLGLNLVKLLSKQIEGEVNYAQDKGTKFKIEFKGYDYAKKKLKN